MKNRLFFLVIIFAIFASVNLRAQQDPPCEYPCDSGIWTSMTNVGIRDYFGCPDCMFYVTYDYQILICNGIQTFNVYFRTATFSSACSNCYFDTQDLLFAAYRSLLQSFINNFSGPKNVVTFSHIACWKEVVPAVFLLEPCEWSTNCCTTTLTYEFIGGHYVCTQAIEYQPQDICPDDCQLTCQTQWYAKKSMTNVINSSRPIIIPNPAKDLVSIQFESSYLGKVNLEVYDISGKKFISINKDKQDLSFQSELDVSELLAGNYILYIYINDSQMVWSNKFVIER